MRLSAFLTTLLQKDLAPLFRATNAVADIPALRGLVHGLTEQGGVMTLPANSPISRKDSHLLRTLGLRAGNGLLFCPRLLRPRAMTLRALLVRIYTGRTLPPLPRPDVVSVRLPPETRLSAQDRAVLMQIGWQHAAGFLIRLDSAWEIHKTLSELAARSGGCPLQPNVASRLGVPAADLPSVLTDLGLRVQKASVLNQKHFGPATPALLLPARTPTRPSTRPLAHTSAHTQTHSPAHALVPEHKGRKTRSGARKQAAPDATGPFAALAVLQKRR